MGAMRLILLGPPGSGKGTQAKHIATGDILRESIRRGTPAGRQAKPYVDNGRLVPDDLVNQLVAERFGRDDRPARFVMDGYPRTVAQAASFDQVLRQQFLDLTAVVRLRVPDAEIIRRLGGRWSCPNPGCKATYHTEHKPPRTPQVCDECRTALVQRNDDRPETVSERLKVYHRDTEELVPYYGSQGLVAEVSGEGDIERIYASIVQVLNGKA
jgi:adenylate kinase